jgi:CubicO group peptidase (beta-lactamase class C family)
MTGATRRSVLGMLGAAPLAGSVLAAAPATRAAAAAAPATRAAAAADPPADPALARELDRLVAERAAQDLFSGTVLLAHRGRPVLLSSYGMANRERSLPNGPDTVFSLASVTKCFAGLAVAQLVQAGKMAFHDTVDSHLDGFPDDANAATVHQLLTHTSGIGRPALSTGIPTVPHWSSFAEAMHDTLAIVRDTPLQFLPGSGYAYSNDGYWVLGAIIAQVSGEPYDEYVRRHIFAPAGMTRSGFYGLPEVLANDAIARPYWTQRSGGRIDFTQTGLAVYTTGPAGGAYAPAADMLAFARALRSGRLLEPAFTDLTTGGKVPRPPEDLSSRSHSVAYGYDDDIVAATRIFGHSGGGSLGAATRLDIVPDKDWVLIVLSNYDTTIAPIVNLARRLFTGSA